MSTYTLESSFLKSDGDSFIFYYFKKYFSLFLNLLNFVEGGRRKRKKIHQFLLIYLLMHPFVDSYMGPAQGLSLQPWPDGRML